MIEMDLSGVRHIQARIAAIQDKFGIPGGVPGMDFDSVLNKAIHQGEKDQLPQAEGAAAAKAPEAASAAAAKDGQRPREVKLTGYAPHTKGGGTLLWRQSGGAVSGWCHRGHAADARDGGFPRNQSL